MFGCAHSHPQILSAQALVAWHLGLAILLGSPQDAVFLLFFNVAFIAKQGALQCYCALRIV